MTLDVDANLDKTYNDACKLDEIVTDTRMDIVSLCAEVRELRAALNSETNRADAAELRAHVLGQRDETETMNIGAALFAVVLRDDTGAGEMPAGPCADVLAEWRRLRQAEAALERAANDLMLSEESFVKMRDKRDDVLRELHAKSAALEHANRFLEQETFTRQKYGDQLHATEAALEQAQNENRTERGEWSKLYALLTGDTGAYSPADLARVVEHQSAALADKQKVCDGLVAAIENNQEIDEEHCRELDAARAALEQARALSEKWAAMKYNGDLTAAVYHGCAEELAALLAAAPGGAA